MAIIDPHGVVTLTTERSIDELLRRAVARIEALGLDVIAVIDHSGEATDAGLTMPETKLVMFGSPTDGTGLMRAHPRIALDLPLKLLLCQRDDGHVVVSYNGPDYLAHRHGLTRAETDALRVVETIAAATTSDP